MAEQVSLSLQIGAHRAGCCTMEELNFLVCRDVSGLFSLITLTFERSNWGFKWQILSCPSLVYRISFWQNNCIVTEEGDKFCRCHFGGSIQLLRAFFWLFCLLVCKRTGCGKRSLLYVSPLLSFDWNIPLRKALPLLPVVMGMLLRLVWLPGDTVDTIYLGFRRKKIFMSTEFLAVFLEHLKM